MAILSSTYGLINSEETIEPYEEILSKNRAEQLLPQIAKKISDYDAIVYYRGGAGKEYSDLIKEACARAGKKLLFTGYKNLGDIDKIPALVAACAG